MRQPGSLSTIKKIKLHLTNTETVAILSVRFIIKSGADMRKVFPFLASGLLVTCAGAALADIENALKEGVVSGNLRMHYNFRDFAAQTDASAFALGGGLRAETGAIGFMKAGVGFYTAQDLGTNNANPAKVDTRMGSNLEVLGESYVTFASSHTSATFGRQKVVTPFANPIDVFIVPFTYEGISIKNNSITNLTFELDYLTTIKSAGSDKFVDVGIWSTNRLGVPVTDTSGTLILGSSYTNNGTNAQAWFYNFDDLFRAQYVQAGYEFRSANNMKPFINAQLITQQESGAALLGNVDTTLIGLQGGATIQNATLSVGFNKVYEQEDAFNNGAFLAPYSFSSSPLFTNNMILSMENLDAGEATKLMLIYRFPQVLLRVSHTDMDFFSIADRSASNLDITYNMNHILEGLSLRYRLEVIQSDEKAVEQSDHRLQLQYTF